MKCCVYSGCESQVHKSDLAPTAGLALVRPFGAAWVLPHRAHEVLGAESLATSLRDVPRSSILPVAPQLPPPLFFPTALIFTCHLIRHLEVHHPVVFSLFTRSCSHRHSLPIHFHHRKKKPHTVGCHPQSLHPSQPLATMHLLSVSMDLPILDTSCDWNPNAAWPFVSFASFT